jgi:trehalose/maltose hydrolase-like predicted phosphorylase
VTDWTLTFDGFDPAEEGLREALTSTGNGYFCSRAAAEWEVAGGMHYPGTYVHGGYNRETTIMGGIPVLNEDLVNMPDWTVLKLRIEGEDAIRLEDVELLSYRHEYDAHYAINIRTVRFRDRAGRATTLRSRRLVSMAEAHQAAIEWTLTPENWSGRVEIVSAIDGRVTNAGVARYRELAGRHLEAVTTRTFGPEVIGLMVRTRQSRIHVAVAARTLVLSEGEPPSVRRRLYQMEDYIQQVLSFEVAQGRAMRIEKLVSFFTSRDAAISEPLGAAAKAVLDYPSFEEALEHHRRAWDQLWEACDLRLPDDERVQFLLRFHISHILQVCSPKTAELDAGVVARGLNGEAYRGHVFWDELYVFPFLNFRLPRVSRHLLMYRSRRLDEARRQALKAGFRGAMYPWQSGSDGEEETQSVHLNPLSGRWDPDRSRLQRHVNAAIAYNVWHHYQATGDVEFMVNHGAEMVLEIARFWASAAHFNPVRERYEIHGVMGPDEFHEKYRGAVVGGLRNNAYTNVMVAWVCETAQRVLDLLPASRARVLRAKIGLTDEEIATWADMSRKMFVPFHEDGVISQFEGYERLVDLDWEAYRARYPDGIARLDRILKAEGEEPDRYKLAKQADTVMLFYLFSSEELTRLFTQLGYDLTPEIMARTIDYYDRRTSHGSTLSYVTHAAALAELDPKSSWERFLVALESDIGDIQGGTTKEGIHMGVMSGTLDLVARGYLGCEVRGDVLYFKPRLLDHLEGLSFSMQFHGAPFRVDVADGHLTVTAHTRRVSRPIKIGIGDDIHELGPQDSYSWSLATTPAEA